MELNSIDRYKDCLLEFGGIPVGTHVENIRVEILEHMRQYLEPKNSRVFLMPYYGFEVTEYRDNTLEIRDIEVPNSLLTHDIHTQLVSDDKEIAFQGAADLIQNYLKANQRISMYQFDDFLIYSETEFGMWELWFHMSGSGSAKHAPKEMDFNAWVDQESSSYVAVSGLEVPNRLYEIAGENLLEKFKW